MKVRENETQINLVIPKSWKEELEREARVISYESNVTISYLEFIKQIMRETFQKSGSELADE